MQAFDKTTPVADGNPGSTPARLLEIDLKPRRNNWWLAFHEHLRSYHMALLLLIYVFTSAYSSEAPRAHR